MNFNPIRPIFWLAFKIISSAVFILTILSAFGGYVNPHLWSFPSMLMLLLPYFAMATLACTLIWVLRMKILMSALGIGTLIVSWSSIIMVFPLGHTRQSDHPSSEFSLVSYNILHGEDAELPDCAENRAFSYILSTGADIVCIQELGSWSKKTVPNISDSLYNAINSYYPYRIVRSAGALSCFSRYPVKTVKLKSSPDADHTFAAYEISLPGGKVTVVNVHLTSYLLNENERNVVTEMKSMRGAKRSFSELKGSIYTKLKQSFPERADDARSLKEAVEGLKGAVIICGDFNDVPASWTYRTIRGDDFRDAFGETNFGPMITYNQHLFLFHIDQILYKGPLKALSLNRGNQKNSDHYPLFAKFELTND